MFTTPVQGTDTSYPCRWIPYSYLLGSLSLDLDLKLDLKGGP